MNHYLRNLIFVIIVILPIKISFSDIILPDIEIDASHGADIAPMVVHEEYGEFTIDSFQVKRWTEIYPGGFRLYNTSKICFDHNIPEGKNFIIWDYHRYVDDKLSDTNWFVTFRYKPGGGLNSRLFCFELDKNETREKITIFEIYRLGNVSSDIQVLNFNVSKSLLFPFDFYNFSTYRSRITVPFVYSSKYILPQSFESEPDHSSIIGDNRVDKLVVAEYIVNNSRIRVPFMVFTFYGEQFRPNIQTFEGNDRVVLLPTTKLLAIGEPIIGNRTILETHIEIKRSRFDLYFFLIFVFFFIILTVAFALEKINLTRLIELSVIL